MRVTGSKVERRGTLSETDLTGAELQRSIREVARKRAGEEGISYKLALKKNRKARKALRRIARARTLKGLDEKVERALGGKFRKSKGR